MVERRAGTPASSARCGAGAAYAGRSRNAPAGAPQDLTAVLTAHDLALAYTRVICAYWRGESEFVSEFEMWLARFWTDCPPTPSTNPTAVCPHGAAGRGIHWFDTGSGILGYVPGKNGCYRIPRTTLLPAFAHSGRIMTGGPLAA